MKALIHAFTFNRLYPKTNKETNQMGKHDNIIMNARVKRFRKISYVNRWCVLTDTTDDSRLVNRNTVFIGERHILREILFVLEQMEHV